MRRQFEEESWTSHFRTSNATTGLHFLGITQSAIRFLFVLYGKYYLSLVILLSQKNPIKTEIQIWFSVWEDRKSYLYWKTDEHLEDIHDSTRLSFSGVSHSRQQKGGKQNITAVMKSDALIYSESTVMANSTEFWATIKITAKPLEFTRNQYFPITPLYSQAAQRWGNN